VIRSRATTVGRPSAARKDSPAWNRLPTAVQQFPAARGLPDGGGAEQGGEVFPLLRVGIVPDDGQEEVPSAVGTGRG